MELSEWSRETAAHRRTRRAKWWLFVAGTFSVALGIDAAVNGSVLRAVSFCGAAMWLFTIFGVMWERYL